MFINDVFTLLYFYTIRTILLLVLLLTLFTTQAQQVDDTIQLKSAVISQPLSKDPTSRHNINFDSASLAHYQTSNLSHLLSTRTPLYIKQYGSQMNALISFRGTAPNHTLILWNNIPINSPSTGQLDLSTIPTFSINQINLFYGGNTAQYGSGALGGIISLENKASWNHISGHFSQNIGSFNAFTSALGFTLANKKISFQSNGLFSSIKNNFPYTNTTMIGHPTVRQENAAIKQYSTSQNIFFKINKYQTVSLNILYNTLDRQIQPTMTSRQSNDKQQDENLYATTTYQYKNDKNTGMIQLAYLSNKITFNSIASATNQAVVQLRYEHSFNNFFKLFTGSFTTFNSASSLNVKNIHEYRHAFHVGVQKIFFNKWLVETIFRKAWATNFQSLHSLSLHSMLYLLNKPHTALAWKTNISKNYRIPTLNERYWQPGGNAALHEEKGWNVETGLNYEKTFRRNAFFAEIACYTQWINNWILWKPLQSYWTPINLPMVWARGFEVELSGEHTILNFQINHQLGYNYTHTSNEDPSSINYTKQLMYTPMHNFSYNLKAKYKSWFSNINLNYTGQRFSQNNETLPLSDFLLTNIYGGKHFDIGKHYIQTSIGINNIFNVTYQNFIYRAMPGRNYYINIIYKFLKPNAK